MIKSETIFNKKITRSKLVCIKKITISKPAISSEIPSTTPIHLITPGLIIPSIENWAKELRVKSRWITIMRTKVIVIASTVTYF